MKVCCDRCEKVIEQGILGTFIGATTLIVEHDVLPRERIMLCKYCYTKFIDFRNGGGENDD